MGGVAQIWREREREMFPTMRYSKKGYLNFKQIANLVTFLGRDKLDIYLNESYVNFVIDN